ncbi:MAG: hypothetical protein QF653_01755, partial [Acidimicrobiales bacterium]|nr:hypothetical protein [Acidimicrobiales bacterium]
MNVRLRRLTAIALSLMVVAAACGSDDAPSSTTAPATTAAPAAADVVEVGPGEAIQIRSLNAISG